MAIVLLSCMSEDRESFSCHIYYFVIINCIISPWRLFLGPGRLHEREAERKSERKRALQLFHFDFFFYFSFASFWFVLRKDARLFWTMHGIVGEHLLIWVEFDLDWLRRYSLCNIYQERVNIIKMLTRWKIIIRIKRRGK